MATNNYAYRMRVYAARSVDATEATVLTPGGSAPHAEEFKVASISGVSGYQPYLHDEIMGRRGRLDLKTRKLDVGTLTVKLIDKRITAGNNLSRWVSAFFGNSAGKPWPRLKVQLDECLDHTATSPTWSVFFTGELVGSKLVDKVGWALTLKERIETLKMKVFSGSPSSSVGYAATASLLPVGFRGSDYGEAKATGNLSATARAFTVNGTSYAPGGEIVLVLPATALGAFNEGNIVTQNLMEIAPPHMVVDLTFQDPSASGPAWGLPTYNGKLRAMVTHGGNTGSYLVGGLAISGYHGHYFVQGVVIKALQSGDVGYLAAPAAATSCTFYLYAEDEVSESRPLLIDDVDPADFIEDLCAGYFGPIYREPMKLPAGKSFGDVTRSVATASFASFTGTRPPMRFVITKSEQLADFIEREILLPNHWGWFLDKSGQVNLVDLKLPASVAGLGTLTDTDIEEEDDPQWEHDPTTAVHRIDLSRYTERVRLGKDLWESADTFPRFLGAAIEETQLLLAPIFQGSIDYGDEVLKVNARGYRSQHGEQYEDRPRSEYLDTTLLELAAEMQRPFAYGLTTIPLRCRRTATVTALNVGSLVIVDVDVVPDPATWKRGGAQLCRVLEYSEDGPNVNLRLVYLSSTSAMTAPSLAQPAQETGNTWTGVTCAVTVNASTQPVVVRYAITDTGTGSAPGDTDPSWRYAENVTGRRLFLTSSQTITIRNLPPNMRVWVQGRTMDTDNTLRLPSAWTAAGGTGKADTAALPAPSVLAAVVSDTTCALSWTNGASDMPVELLLATPTSDPRARIALLPPGSTAFTLQGLTVSTQYRSEVRHTLGQHVGAGDTEDFTTSAAATTAPALTSLQVLGAT